MSIIKGNPRYNVISMRISEAERRVLEKLVQKSHKNVSRIMRDAFEYFAASLELPKAGGTAM